MTSSLNGIVIIPDDIWWRGEGEHEHGKEREEGKVGRGEIELNGEKKKKKKKKKKIMMLMMVKMMADESHRRGGGERKGRKEKQP